MTSRIKFKPDPKAPKPYNFGALQRYMRAEAKRLEEATRRVFANGNPWLDLLLTGRTFQIVDGQTGTEVDGTPNN